MSNTISGGISFSGIGSGTDFAAMLEQLVEVESFRLYSLEDSRTEATDAYDAFSELIDSVSEAKESLELLNSPSKFLTKIASSSNEAMLGVKAEAEAVDGTHKIEVTQLASNSIWANKNTFAEKTSAVNTTSMAQDFSYTYMGETRTLSVQPGTTLESFVNMVNSDRSNPGVKMSIIKTGGGYSFQVSGEDSGADATLQIHTSALEGLSGAGATWTSTSAVDITAPMTNSATVKQYQYDLTMVDGQTYTTGRLDGDATQQEIVDAINADYTSKGGIGELAQLVDGTMTISGLESMTTTTYADSSATTGSPTTNSVTPTTSFSMHGTLMDTTYGAPASYTFVNSKGNDVVINMDTGHTQRDILAKLNEQGYAVEATTVNGVSNGTIKGITDLSALTALDAAIIPPDTMESFNIDTGSLNDTLGPANYSFTNALGQSFNIAMGDNHTQMDILDALSDRGYGYSVVESTSDPTVSGVAINGLSDISALTATIPSATAPLTTAQFSVSGDLSQNIVGDATYNFLRDDGSTEEVIMVGDHTQEQVLAELEARGYTVAQTTNAGRTTIAIMGVTGVDDFLATDPNRVAPSTSTVWPDFTKSIEPTESIQEGLVPSSMQWSFTLANGTTTAPVTVTSDMSIEEALTLANIDYSTADGKLVLHGVSAVHGVPDSVGLTGSLTGSDAWEVQEAQDAIFKIDNWPQEITSSTNEVKDVIEGVTLTLRDVGTAQFTVASDTDSVKENVQLVLDALNSVLKKVQDLTAVSTEPSSTYDSTGTEVTAGELTGNYSVNLFSSRLKSAAGGVPPGFQTMTTEDIFSGDFIAALSQMGIKISSDTDSPDFGLFAIAPAGSTDEIQALDQALFDDAIENHLDDVIAFFSSDSVGTSSSPNFRYANHIDGLTEPGTYSVKYDVDASGNIGTVYINGVEASPSDSSPNAYSVGNNAGGAGGLTIVIDNLSPNQTVNETVSIQQGKVNQMIEFFEAELKYVAPNVNDPGLSDDNGGLMVAKESYAELIRSLDDQITDEIARLDRWEYTQKLKYARLDTLLGEYDGQMTMLNNQLAQLGS